MKFIFPLTVALVYWSPSMRREWIEISSHSAEQTACLSPSMRREWIEMVFSLSSSDFCSVSLHAEGVD